MRRQSRFSCATTPKRGILVSPRSETLDSKERGRRNIPNCFIYCLSQTTPTIASARTIDPCYDDWFEIADATSFISRLFQLLGKQIRPADLELPSGVSFSDCGIFVFGGSVAYGERHVLLDHENFEEAMEPIRDPVKRLFLKPSGHESIEEYRIAFVVTDNGGRGSARSPRQRTSC